MKGRGTSFNLNNPFLKNEYSTEHIEGLDESFYPEKALTQYIFEHPKKILSKNDSPDVHFTYSVNPYQGCEHGCAYCYARNSHLYWGLGAGLDFERKIIVKKEAPILLEREFLRPGWTPQLVALSGNTDCYQPAEQKFQLTRALLRVFKRFGNPVGIITKNALVSRDLDILKSLHEEKLVKVYFSITSLKEEVRRLIEPRTSSAKNKLKAMEQLSSHHIPVGVMMGPIIPGINDEEIDAILKSASDAGAREASYTVVRLNGQLAEYFKSWLDQHLPERKEKVLNKIASLHGDSLNDSKWSRRMKGEGELSKILAQLFDSSKRKYFGSQEKVNLNTGAFRKNANLNLFD